MEGTAWRRASDGSSYEECERTVSARGFVTLVQPDYSGHNLNAPLAASYASTRPVWIS